MGHPAEQTSHQVIINDRSYLTYASGLDGRDLLDLAAFRPASDYSIVQFDGFGTKAIGLDECISLEADKPSVFRVFRGDRLFRAILNEKELLWGEAEISAVDLRLIGDIPDDQDLYLDSDRDRPIADDGSVRLKRDGVERIRSGDPRDETLDVILNGQVITIENGRLSFEQLAKLAFPDLFGRDLICFTVSFSRGPKRRREGVLLEGNRIRVVKGMVFNVSATDKS